MNGIDLGLAGKVVLVTGASGGVGRAIALAFAEAGSKVAIIDVAPAGLDETRGMVEQLGAKAHAQTADISNAAQMDSLVESIAKALGPIDVLVNNAAVMTEVKPFVDIDPAAWERDIRIGLLGTMCCTRAVVRAMLARGPQSNGVIVNIASDAGRAGNANLVGYSSTKGGVIAFTKALAQEVGPAGIRVNAVSPGSVRAPMRDQVLRDIEDRMGSQGVEAREAQRTAQVPLRRVAEPDDIAKPVLFFASTLSRHVTGQVLSVNGGFRMY